MIYLVFAVAMALIMLTIIGLRRWRQYRREHAFQSLLDGADMLEHQLQQCRERMHKLKNMLAILPEEMRLDASIALSADTKVEEALRDVLAHRLWIKQHAGTATQNQLDKACNAMRQSNAILAQQLGRLAQIAVEFERAQTNAQFTGRHT